MGSDVLSLCRRAVAVIDLWLPGAETVTAEGAMFDCCVLVANEMNGVLIRKLSRRDDFKSLTAFLSVRIFQGDEYSFLSFGCGTRFEYSRLRFLVFLSLFLKLHQLTPTGPFLLFVWLPTVCNKTKITAYFVVFLYKLHIATLTSNCLHFMWSFSVLLYCVKSDVLCGPAGANTIDFPIDESLKISRNFAGEWNYTQVCILLRLQSRRGRFFPCLECRKGFPIQLQKGVSRECRTSNLSFTYTSECKWSLITSSYCINVMSGKSAYVVQ